MNPKQMYLAWVRSYYPTLYYNALNQTFGKGSGLAGLGDDLTDSIDPTASIAAIGIGQDTSDAIDSAYNAAQQDSTNSWDALANAITSTANSVVQTQAAEQLLQVNANRARLGLPLYTSNGQTVTPQMLVPGSATVAQMEAALSGSGSLWLLAAVAAVFGVYLLSQGGSHTDH